MSSVRTPRGPQPSSVYWRRRLVVLLGAAAVIAVIVLIFVRPPSHSPIPVGTVAPDTAEGPEPATPADPSAVCDASQVSVEAITDSDSYAPDALPQLSWSLVNTGTSPCTLNVGTAQQVFTITSGAETIWSSQDCQTDPADYPLVVEPASAGADPAVSAAIAWDRERSTPDSCDAEGAEQVTAGGASYHLEVTVGGIASTDSKQFVLN